MVQPNQLRDSNTPPSGNVADPEIYKAIGSLQSSVTNLDKKLDEQADKATKVLDALANFGSDFAKIYSGLDNANKDLMIVRQRQDEISQRLDNTVTEEDVTKMIDSRLQQIGVYDNDRDVYQFINNGITREKNRSTIRTRVIGGVALAVALALCAALWTGLDVTYIKPGVTQHEEKTLQ